MKLKVTPEMAKEWLESHVNFRPLDRARVRQYCRDMASGNWSYNGESIKFNASGKMFDGQHRCAAIIEAGIPIVTEVIEGIEDERGVDEGKGRKASDYLRSQGIRNASILASAAALLVRYSRGQMQNTGFRISDAMIQSMLEEAPTLVKIVSSHGCQSRSLARTPLRNACGHVFRYLIMRANKAEGCEFWQKLTTGDSLQQHSPVWLLREYMVSCASRFGHKRPDSRHALALSIKAWNAHAMNKPIRSLTFRRGLESSEQFPSVKGFEIWLPERHDAFTFDSPQDQGPPDAGRVSRRSHGKAGKAD